MSNHLRAIGERLEKFGAIDKRSERENLKSLARVCIEEDMANGLPNNIKIVVGR
jgi:hypothetical protein